ncbi:MAG TPA: hypothetical protein ENJ37_01975 [Deltaproteobacteria bacterium]|nr:hypothetical protein [Deltaproteobacteria bacterium]
MAKTATALKGIVRREEALLAKLVETTKAAAMKETKAALREIAKGKREHIRALKKLVTAEEKCAAKPASKCGPRAKSASTKKKTAAKDTSAKAKK